MTTFSLCVLWSSVQLIFRFFFGECWCDSSGSVATSPFESINQSHKSPTNDKFFNDDKSNIEFSADAISHRIRALCANRPSKVAISIRTCADFAKCIAKLNIIYYLCWNEEFYLLVGFFSPICCYCCCCCRWYARRVVVRFAIRECYLRFMDLCISHHFRISVILLGPAHNLYLRVPASAITHHFILAHSFVLAVSLRAKSMDK